MTTSTEDALVRELREQLYELAIAADRVMDDLKKHGPSIVPHLMDDDDNDGWGSRN